MALSQETRRAGIEWRLSLLAWIGGINIMLTLVVLLRLLSC